MIDLDSTPLRRTTETIETTMEMVREQLTSYEVDLNTIEALLRLISDLNLTTRPPGGGPPPTYHSYKVLIDPMIHKGAEKQVRYDGSVVPGNPHHVSPSCTDPRKKPIPSQVENRFFQKSETRLNFILSGD